MTYELLIPSRFRFCTEYRFFFANHKAVNKLIAALIYHLILFSQLLFG